MFYHVSHTSAHRYTVRSIHFIITLIILFSNGSKVLGTVVQMCESHDRTPTFRLPQDPEGKQRWLKARKNSQGTKNTVVCEVNNVPTDCF